MKKFILATAIIITLLVAGVVGYIIYDMEVLNKDWARTVDRGVIVSSGRDMKQSEDDLVNVKNDINCKEYNYSFESETLSCEEGAKILFEAANTEIELGKLYQGFETTPLPREHLEKTIEASEKYLKALDEMKRFDKSFVDTEGKEFVDQYNAIKDNMKLFREILG